MSADPTKVNFLYASSLITKLNYFTFNITLQMFTYLKMWENYIGNLFLIPEILYFLALLCND